MKMISLLKHGVYMASLLCSLSAAATTINIVNADGPGEGFNDTTPVAPTGGNSGTTLGEQRLEVFRYAASIWATEIDSNVEIKVEAKFDPLSCNSSSAVLGSAGTTTVHRDFSGAPLSGTWYPQALANAISGTDLSTGNPDLSATFNSAIDNNNNCLNRTSWYLGLDGNAGNDIDLADVVMHEIGHGLGFASYVDENTGQGFFNYLDVYSVNLEDHSLGQTWDLMTNNQRKTSAVDSGDLHFVGVNTLGSAGHAPIYAPNPAQPGSSVSHFDTTMDPNELMEPYIAAVPIHDVGFAYEVMLDLGWAPANQPGNTPPEVAISSPTTGAVYNVGDSVSLEAGATDQEDGVISASIDWVSDIDGFFGSGASQTVSLSAGDHVISAMVMDSAGVTASDQVSVTVNANVDSVPVAPSGVTARDFGGGVAEISWLDKSDNEVQFDIVRESPHKKRPNTWVGSTQLSSEPADTTSTQDESGSGTFRYCISASNTAGASESICSGAVEITASGGDGGGNTGGGSFCDSHPNHKRCK